MKRRFRVFTDKQIVDLAHLAGIPAKDLQHNLSFLFFDDRLARLLAGWRFVRYRSIPCGSFGHRSGLWFYVAV